MHKFWTLLIILSCALVAILSYAQEKSYTINADSVEYDNKTDKITAEGKVEIFRDNYILKADKIIYYKEQDKAFAYGNVYLLTPDGDEIYADDLELDNKLKEIIAKQVKARLTDDNKFIASNIHHYTDHIVFENVRYSPCPTCPNIEPQWQLHSKKIYYEKKKDVSYWHNFFEAYGVPVFYFPYIRTPAPDAEPRSGFLIPSTQRYNQLYGYSVTVPYYWRIADNKDFTYSPMITSNKGMLHSGKFRHLIKDGYYDISGDYIRSIHKTPKEPLNRFYVNANAKYKIDDKFKLTGKAERVSDKSYLINYWDVNKNYLTSDVALDYENYRDYGSVKAYHFQGLRTENDNDEMPFIAPVIQTHKEYYSGGNIYLLDLNILNLLRKEGTNVRRASAKLGWNKTYLFGNHEIELLRSIRGDIYNFDKKQKAEETLGLDESKTVPRALPQIELIWKYPLLKRADGYNIFLAPTADLILSPNTSSNKEVSVNEDSQKIEIDDTNLFSSDRYSGLDFIEHGVRMNYGLSGYLLTNGGTEYNLLFGQSYMLKKNDEYNVDSGLKNKHFSDYVGRIGAKPLSFLEVYYKARIDSKNQTLRRSEVGANFNFKINSDIINALVFNSKFVDYNLLSAENNSGIIRKSLILDSKLYIYNKWYVGGEIIKNFSKEKSFNVHSKASMGYDSGCTNMRFSAIKRYTSDPRRDIIATKGFIFEWEIHLKNIN